MKRLSTTTILKFTIILSFSFVLSIIANSATASGAEVVFLGLEGPDPDTTDEIKSACELLGVRLNAHLVKMGDNDAIRTTVKELQDLDAIILSARLLKHFSQNLGSLLGPRHKKTKVLILGLDAETDITDVKHWSDNRIKNINSLAIPSHAVSVRVVKNESIAKELGGLEYPLTGTAEGTINGFELDKAGESLELIELVDASGQTVFPVLLQIKSAENDVFFLSSVEKSFSSQASYFLRIMPILIFLKYAFADRVWHGTHDYANFTIDDPWLREPYGYIGFADLCREAVEKRFHVTIGFVPYNYQRSDPRAVEIFRRCHEVLSISVHGNNHDFSEFRSGTQDRGNSQSHHDIHPDEKNILQALHRMETLRNKTGLSYDRVMIFPRGVFNTVSLGLLKQHNFLMTINSTRPLNAGQPVYDAARIREITLEFENFPVVTRHGIPDFGNRQAVADAKTWMQLRLFLDLPVLLYTHHGFLKDGPAAFNSIADFINTAQPDVVWTSLGNVAKRLYMQRRTETRKMEVLGFSSDLVIKNTYLVAMKYVVRKQEDFLTPIQYVEVDGVKHDYSKKDGHITIEVTIEPDREKNIRISYHSNYQVDSFTYSDNALQPILIRSLSDFRDIYLTKLPFGNRFVTAFYSMGGVRNVLWIGVSGLMALILMVFVYYTRRTHGKKRIL